MSKSLSRLARVLSLASLGASLALAAGAVLLTSAAPALAQLDAPPKPPLRPGQSDYDLVDPGHLAGVWVVTNYRASSRYSPSGRVTRTLDGKFPPLQAWAAKLLNERIEAGNQGHPFANTPTNCLPGGMPAIMLGGNTPIEIIPMRGEVVMLFEELDLFRHIYMNEAQAKIDDLDPTYMGHSVAHWEGDTLVVDTIGTTDKTTLDGAGTPHTEAQHIIERLRRHGDEMDDLITIDDPKAFTASWSTKAIYKFLPGRRLQEYICDNNRNGSVNGETEGFTFFGQAK